MARRRIHREGSFSRGRISQETRNAVERLRQKGERVLSAAKTALAAGVDRIVVDAKSRCPVKTGKLRDSVKAVELENGTAYELTADAVNDQGVAYGQFVEFDPRINSPFLYPAVDANIQSVRRDVELAIQTAISR